ncbi:NAD(P)-dependent oxidoreductase [Devosia sp. BK]|uniref:NAD-dependent epimerase/dehydratase family protein n=1 Tax=Devosia sp. BK TaxID=2871706 RepID=UPI00293A1D30|nr:NAD(P)-dependent oxidoreductase [Devosia sp. BK]MDV3253712.1 NAD(P)-dependent oxidoreductase [Devosia sp. BK]
MTKTLLTGASGVLGSHLHAHMLAAGRSVIATDLRPAGDERDVIEADLSNADAVNRLVKGTDAVVHFGAISNEKSWDLVQAANIEGTRNIFESAHTHGVRRVIFASSYHVMGFHPTRDTPIRLDAPVRPDTLYGISKVFGESYGRYCYDRYGLECLVVRICTAFPPKSSRDARNFCDRDDLARLVDAGLDLPDLGFRTVYAISDNPNPLFVNEPDPGLGWSSQSSSRAYPEIAPEAEIDLDEPVNRVVGGAFALPRN